MLIFAVASTEICEVMKKKSVYNDNKVLICSKNKPNFDYSSFRRMCTMISRVSFTISASFPRKF